VHGLGEDVGDKDPLQEALREGVSVAVDVAVMEAPGVPVLEELWDCEAEVDSEVDRLLEGLPVEVTVGLRDGVKLWVLVTLAVRD
jgi:hypothetical protein